MWKVYLFEAIITIVISILWVRGIDKMTTNHSDYKGEDFLNDNINEKNEKTN